MCSLRYSPFLVLFALGAVMVRGENPLDALGTSSLEALCYNSLGIAVALMLGRADNQVVTNRYKPLRG